MLNNRFLLFTTFVFFASSAKAQDRTAVMAYIANYKTLAISEMKRTGVPAAIKLAQGIHETDAGQSKLVLKSNNHFGIKCKSTWRGPSVKHDDDARNECFRAYPGTEDSYRDHSDFLRSGTRYASLFTLDPTDYAGWARGLKKAGYATNPKYPQILIRIIEEYELQNYTLIAMGKMEEKEVWLVDAETEKPSETEDETAAGPEVLTAAMPEVRAVNYPEGEFRINDTRVVFVTNGTAFFSVAQKYNVPLARLFEFNDMRPVETAEHDQLIYLQRKRKSGANEFHLVKPGETLYSISQEEGIRLESLLEYNLLKPGMQPAEGERLHLKTKASSAPALTGKGSKASVEKLIRQDASTVKNATLHTVRKKETLYTISKIYGVSVDEVMNWNSMRDNELKPGQQLKIYKTSHHVNHKGS